jgi:polyisoprenoid-binding protein YceI
MPLERGRHTLGPEQGKLEVRTYREGVAQKAGHDLIIDVDRWQATAEVTEACRLVAVELEVDPRSLRVREGLRGVMPLTDKDREKIQADMEGKVLGGTPITFRSSEVDGAEGRLRVHGELTVAGRSQPVEYVLELTPDGRLQGTLQVTQTDHGIRPYRGLMGALKVRDAVDVVLDVQLPAASSEAVG